MTGMRATQVGGPSTGDKQGGSLRFRLARQLQLQNSCQKIFVDFACGFGKLATFYRFPSGAGGKHSSKAQPSEAHACACGL